MTVTQSAARRDSTVEVLTDSDLAGLRHLIDADPIVNAVVAARVAGSHTLSPSWLGGTMLGIRDDDRVRAAAFSGGNLIALGGEEADWTALARRCLSRPRVATSIVGRAPAVAAMWGVLEGLWGPARAVRSVQPLLLLEQAPTVTGDGAVRRVARAEIEGYVAASAAMFTEELGISPYHAPGEEAFRSRVLELIDAGRAFAIFDFRGQVLFKADIGVVSPHTCQVQGVWVRPDLRGRGIATAALVSVLEYAFTLAPTVSLYVNDFNAPARRVYDKLGMHVHATLSTVLL